MSLLDDTLRDARRPLALRFRAALIQAAAPAMPDPVGAVDAAERCAGALPSGDRGEARDRPGAPVREAHEASAVREERTLRDDFQREGQLMSREASYPSGSGLGRLPAGDPLSAAMGAERPKSSAKNVGMTDVTVMGDSRTSELATGPEKGRSPGKVAAVAASSESKTLQSAVLSGPIEAEWSRARSLSMTPEGSTTTVSARGETFLSRPSGRGAPSENPWPDSVPTPPATTAATVATGDVRRPATREALASADEAPDAQRVRRASGERAMSASATREAVASAGPAARQLRVAVSAPAVAPTAPARQRPGRDTPSVDVVPTLSIGRIDVTVVADGAHVAPAIPAEAFGDAGFLACNYLKRL